MSATAAQPLPYSPDDEHPTRGEEKGTAALLKSVRYVQETVRRDTGHAARGVHAKAHGLLRGELRVLDGLPPELAQGIFARPGAAYPVVVRLSTLPGDVLDDSVSTPRGMAVKVSGAEGSRLPGSEGDTAQDFVMASGPPIFVSPDIRHFARKFRLFAATADTGQLWKKALSLALRAVSNALEAAGLARPGLQGHLFGLGGQALSHPLGESYASQTAYRYGEHVAKLKIVPVSPELVALRDAPFALSGPDGLRDAVVEHFRTRGAEWELRVQLRTDRASMPVEDPTIAWPEGESPYRPVARITAPPQPAWSEASGHEADDRLSFSPWHGIEDHRPLGSVNRARKAIYATSAGYRAAHARCPLSPQANPDPHAPYVAGEADMAGWKFRDPPNVAAFTTRGIVEGHAWIALVTHDADDGAWQFHDASPGAAQVRDGMLVCLRDMVARDESLNQLADLPEGCRAWREAPDAPWQREPIG